MEVANMNDKQKCCILLFDETSLHPTLNFNEFYDVVDGGSCDMMDAAKCDSVTIMETRWKTFLVQSAGLDQVFLRVHTIVTQEFGYFGAENYNKEKLFRTSANNKKRESLNSLQMPFIF